MKPEESMESVLKDAKINTENVPSKASSMPKVGDKAMPGSGTESGNPTEGK